MENNKKDIHRFSYSRLQTFKQCPMKHKYQYIEQIESGDSKNTIPGSLFHKAYEAKMKGEDLNPIFKQWDDYCLDGTLKDYPVGLMQRLVTRYFQYYEQTYKKEKTELVEYKIEEQLEDDDYLIVVIDELIRLENGMYKLRDHKTSLKNFKYSKDDVRYNEQLLTYVVEIEDKLNITIDVIEIDEIIIADIMPVPLLKSGKPSTDKNSLSLVAYEDYYSVVREQGLEMQKEYINALEFLEQRGHPLFRRTNVQLSNRVILSTNAKMFSDEYESCKFAIDNDISYRTKGPLCNYCAYKQLCILDYSNPDQSIRQAVINNIKK